MKYLAIILCVFVVSTGAQAREIKPFNLIYFPQLVVEYPELLGSKGSLAGLSIAREKVEADLKKFVRKNPDVFEGVEAHVVYVETCSSSVCGEFRVVAGKFMDDKKAYQRCYAARDKGNRCQVLHMRNATRYSSDLFHAVKYDIKHWFK